MAKTPTGDLWIIQVPPETRECVLLRSSSDLLVEVGGDIRDNGDVVCEGRNVAFHAPTQRLTTHAGQLCLMQTPCLTSVTCPCMARPKKHSTPRGIRVCAAHCLAQSMAYNDKTHRVNSCQRVPGSTLTSREENVCFGATDAAPSGAPDACAYGPQSVQPSSSSSSSANTVVTTAVVTTAEEDGARFSWSDWQTSLQQVSMTQVAQLVVALFFAWVAV